MLNINTFKYHVFCTDGKISVRINLPLFSIVVPSIICMFLSCMPFVVITTLSTGLVGVEVTSVSYPSQETEVTATPSRPVDNVVIATKGLQDRNTNIIAGTTGENKGKLILTLLEVYLPLLSARRSLLDLGKRVWRLATPASSNATLWRTV